MATLADLFSLIDSKKRQAADVLSNPGLSLMQALGNANDKARAFNELGSKASEEMLRTGDAFGPYGRQQAQILADAYNPAGMMVYHGGGKLFSKFDPKMIGSGEGAQQYGYGHYLSASPDLAFSYTARDPVFEKTLMSAYDKAQRANNYSAAQVYEDFLANKTPASVLESLSDFSAKDMAEAKKAFDFANKAFQNQKSSGFYKVDLPDEQIAKMVKWDQPLREQTPEVKALAKQYGLTDADHLGGDLVAAMNAKTPAGAESMRKAGVPGISYLDESTRAGSKGANNFVVFPGNEGLLNILERNNAPITQEELIKNKALLNMLGR